MRSRVDHKLLIVPQWPLSPGISLFGICAKSENLLASLPGLTVVPQIRPVAALNAVGARAVTSRTGTARSTTNTQSVREHFSRDGVLGSSLAEWIRKVLLRDGRASMSTGSELSAVARLYASLAAIRRSPIVLRRAERVLLAREWASVRKSPDVDAYILAWIANHVRGARRPPRTFM